MLIDCRYKKTILLLLLLFVLFSIVFLNNFILDLNNQKKNYLRNICELNIYNDSKENQFLNKSLLKVKLKYNNNNNNNNELKYDSNLANISNDIFLYSAFESLEDSIDSIVIIGFAKSVSQINSSINFRQYSNSYQYMCAFDNYIKIKTLAFIEYLPESHDYYYSAIKILCKKPKLFQNSNQNSNQNELTLTVTKVKLIKFFFQSKLTIESNLISIHFHNYQNINNKEIVVCVRPLFGNISIVNLLEFIAYYRINGINKLVFYNTFVESSQLIQMLSSMPSFVELIPFFIPKHIINDKIHANGQLVAVHDCLHRFNNQIQIHVDFDEYLMPFNYNSIKSFLLSNSFSLNCALIVPIVFFCNEFNQLSKSSINSSIDNSLVISNFVRQKTVWPHEIRSKIIVIRPKLISQMGIHNIWKLSKFNSRLRPDQVSNIDSNSALIYHYRSCCDISQPYFWNLFQFNTINDYIVRDESMNKFIYLVNQFINNYVEIVN
jgi:hypothetical protein